MTNVIHFLLGTGKIRIKGRFPERFVNLCAVEGIPFRDLEREGEHSITLRVDLPSVHRCRALARQALCELELVEGEGLPHFVLGLRRRAALLTGLVCALFAALFLSRFVLVVTVTGNESVSDSVILTELEEQGFGVLTYGPGVDRRALANEVLRRLPQLSFLSVNISGISAQVVVREAAPEPELEDRDEPGDVVAAVDGVITRMNPVIGQRAAEEGQAVLAGEVLISGTEEQVSGDGTGTVFSRSQVRAEGSVWALTRRTLRCVTPLDWERKEYTGEKKSLWSLGLGKRQVKFRRESSFFPLSCDRIERTWQSALPGGGTLPVSVQRRSLTVYDARPARVSRESAEAFLRQRLEERLKALMGEQGEVLSRELGFEERDGALIGTLTASCEENIARQAAPGGNLRTASAGNRFARQRHGQGKSFLYTVGR